MEQKRDNYLDFIRGLAALNIIFIHTTFWSGQSYVPEIIQSMSLALDVPFFFFISGVAFSYVRSFEKNVRSLLRLYKRYILFMLFYFGCLLITAAFTGNSSGLTLRNFYSNLFFIRDEQTSLPVVMSSMWFMPVYFAVSGLGSIVVCTIWKLAAEDERKYHSYCELLLFAVLMGLLYTYLGGNFLYLSSKTLFYMFFYLLGVVCQNVKFHSLGGVFCFVAADLVCMMLLGICLGWDISNMQGMKSPPNMIYLLYSLVSVVVALYGKSKITVSPDNLLCRVGRNAIHFYFCQGISSSLLYYVVSYIKSNSRWYLALPIAYLCNLLMTLLFIFVFRAFERTVEAIPSKRKQGTA